MTKAQPGDIVNIHGDTTYAEDAIVRVICHPDELPSIDGAPNVDMVRAILAEGSFVSVALIEYKFLDETLAFIALENTRGQWTDLKGQALLIEPRRATNEARRRRA
jgi:hypothetical protein